MKYALTLLVALVANWLLWSGHFDNPFLIGLGAASCLFCLWLSSRMKIVDEEGAPAHLGLRPFLLYAPWLAKEIVTSNINVARIILSPVMPLRRNLILVPAKQKSEIGRVIFANSITLTPGTVSVRLEGNNILVHGLSLDESADDMAGEMGERVCRLERCENAAANECDDDSVESQPNTSGQGES
ncbi:multicomponent Na+:H+ antiporter subunit E [Rhodopirellula rubra]|uniref:Multicomponent Na+:H+ antiporter subunit E n=1 Tax=Aporhodopirellula rubra TaxID=980271 RepID=A0A7W5DZ49_9BACT|nr:Na+/H+ antiporter subunit E [Aporhodopirellula rubra]MBB3206869.1 multicomponent Na+:H+ antiporter subunit E [Aporhodopirellula rubra]